MPRTLVTLPLLAGTLSWIACGDATAPPVATTVLVSPTDVTLDAVGATTQFAAQVLDQNGQPMGGVSLSWSSSDLRVADVHPVSGLATARGNGTATITATAGRATGSARLSVQQVPKSLAKVGGDGQTGTAGSPLPTPLVVEVRDGGGTVIAQVNVQFAVTSGGGSVTPSSAATGPDGRASAIWTLGTAVTATNTLRATVAPLAVDFTATAAPGPAANLVRVSGDAQTGEAGQPLRDSLVVKVTDRFGNPVAGTSVQWAATSGGGTLSPATVTTGASGLASSRWTLGPTAGTQSATATAAGLAGSPVTFTATATASDAPSIASISPSPLAPGDTARITGANFSPTPANNSVHVDGVAATVLAATSTTLRVALPTTGFACEPTRQVTVAVTVGARTGSKQHPLRVATLRTLAAGEAVTILEATRVRCNELAATGGRFIVSVFNTSTSAAALSAFQLRGAAGLSGGAAVAAALELGSTRSDPGTRSTTTPVPPPAPNSARAASTQAPQGFFDLEELRRKLAAHRATLEENLRTLERLRAQPAAAARGPAAATAQAEPPPQVGDRIALRIPKWGSANLCTNFTDVTARVVYSGSRAVVLEDTLAPLKGTMDSLFVRLGQEYDNTMHAIIEQNFGNPLALDAQLDNNGRIFMLFSKVVNDFGSIAAFVFSGDFFDRSQCASSNKREIFYAVVPTSSDAGFGRGTPGGWWRTMRSTVIHEVKHITSFAERLSRSALVFEESWLEEATAMVAEELWARGVFGYGHRGNVSYSASLYCEVRPSWPECAGKPLVMYDHFALLYDYYTSVETLTPLGAVNSDDFTFYGSGWSLVRWAVDQYAASESGFLKALVQDAALRGLGNLTARTGKTYPEMLGDWTVANAVDDLAGFAPARAQLTHPSWNTRDIFAGMNRDFGSIFTSAFPLAVRALAFGSFTMDVPAVRGGTAAIFELSGTQTGTQLVEVRSAGGGDPPPTLRVAIVRVQ